jgi:TonB-linked SusC/RagA family outer membrane protein
MRSSSVRWRMRAFPLAAALLLALGAATPAFAQAGSIRGVVTDSMSGMPVAGAMVSLAGTDRGTLTGANGLYFFRNLAAGTYTVAVEHIGFGRASREAVVAQNATVTLDFALASTTVELSELVVVGYGQRTRMEVTSSIATLQAAELVDVPIASIDAAMQGQLPGVQVVQNAGNPGNAMTVRIRGNTSVTANNQPLYVVDGVPILQEDYTQISIGGQNLSAITGLAPDEIESIDILKDASAAAIYGSRGSNGVVLITTRRGRAGAPRATFSVYTGWADADTRLDLLDASEYLEYMNEAAANDGFRPDSFGVAGVSDRVNTDWQEAVLRPAGVSNFNAALSGGTDRLRYYLSGSYFDQEGVVIGSQYARANGRVNLDFVASDRLSLKTSLGVSREDADQVQGDGSLYGVVTYAISENPMIAPRDNAGRFTGPDDGLTYWNAVALGELNPTEAITVRTLGNIEAEYRLFEGLSLTGRAGADLLTATESQWQSPLVEGTYPSSVAGVSKSGYSANSRFVLEGFANWDAMFDRLGHLTLTGGSSVEMNNNELNFIRGEGFSNIETHQIRNAATITDFDGSESEHHLVSVFSRAHYNLLDRYFATASLRADGSSRFSPDTRWGVFPAISGGWLMSAENFFHVPAVSTLRWRGSWGKTGNQEIGNYPYQGLFGSANYGGRPGLSPSSIENLGLEWEKTTEWNAGFEAGLLADRVLVGFDLYNKTTSDLLLDRPITTTSGFSSVIANVGEIVNDGWELSLTLQSFTSEDPAGFNWTTEFNISHNENEVTKLFDGQPFNAGERSINRVEEGQPIGAFHALRFEGVDPATGDAIYFDADGNDTINALDRVIVGSPHPDYYGGFTNRFAFRNFDLSVFLSFSQGADMFNAMRIFAADGGASPDNKFGDVLDRWQEPGDDTDEPRASLLGNSGGDAISSRFIEDASYIRLQEVTLGYRIPDSIGGRVGLSSARLYVSGRNLHTFTDYSGYSPDVNSNGASANIDLGTDFYAYPIPRTITIGISAGL